MERRALHKAFKHLESLGFFAPRKAWQCCQSCGCAAVPEGKPYVFYHQQDLAHARESGKMYLSWGNDVAHGHQIVFELRAAGLNPKWNGTHSYRILVEK